MERIVNYLKTALESGLEYIKKRRWYFISAAVVILLLPAFFRDPALPVETSTVKRGIYEQIIEEEGITQVKENFTLYSPVNGILRRIERHAGDPVKKGDVVALIDWDYARKVTAPITGTILRIHRESAGPVAMGSPLMDIGDTSQLEIIAEVLTQEAVAVRPGNAVTIEGWGGTPVAGTVRTVEPAAFKKISSLGVEEQRVRVIVDFTPPEGMGEGFRVYLRIIAFQKPDSVLVPSAAIFRDGEDWVLFRVDGGKARRTPVIVEHRSGTVVSVKEGVKEGDVVILYPGELIRDGVRVD